jgi:hypothetical protein
MSGYFLLVCTGLSHIAVQAEEYARISYRILFGEDETFDETFYTGRPEMLGKMTI